MLASVLMSSVLARPGHAGEQAVAAGEEGDQHLIDDLVLADDHQPQLLQNPRAPRRDPGREIFAVFLHRRVMPLPSRRPVPARGFAAPLAPAAV